MDGVIMRSRIAFWTAFRHGGGAYLNARRAGSDGSVTLPLTEEEAAVLGAGGPEASRLASAIAADAARRTVPSIPTPSISHGEPPAIEWEPAPRERAAA